MVRKRKFSRRKKITSILLALLAIIALGWLLWHTLRGTPKVSNPSSPISHLPGQSSTNGQKKVTPSSTINQQTSTDNNGQTPNPVTTSPSQWSQSQSGVIIVKQPIANSTFSPDGTLSGSAKVDKVQYRLIDDQVGVISEGTISVVNGNFSATVHFKPYAKSGRLDVFSTNADGVEENEVQIVVQF